jgi:hypothetical protein
MRLGHMVMTPPPRGGLKDLGSKGWTFDGIILSIELVLTP